VLRHNVARAGVSCATKLWSQEETETGLPHDRLPAKSKTRSVGEDGTGRIKPGARVRVRVTVRVPAERHHVALVDPLAAGLEPIDGSLRGSDASDAMTSAWDHVSLRDDRTEAFQSGLGEGSHEFVYETRAKTPGRFLAPAQHVEDMYHAEVFGRGAPSAIEVR
jgi:uncharacterized protein YfaS (alpha-2-macroglobulin family)